MRHLHPFSALTLFLILVAAQGVRPTLGSGAPAISPAPTPTREFTVTPRKGITMNWFFHNTDAKYGSGPLFAGYYKDYNQDGLLDYLVVLQDPILRDWRLFTLDTSPSGGGKTYADNKTAGRDITAALGSFVPLNIYLPRRPGDSAPDLVILGTDKATSISQDFTTYKFLRLNKNDPAFPDDLLQIAPISGVNRTMSLIWPDVSMNGDDYPDFFIYSSSPDANKQFHVSCYDGLDGVQLWTKTLSLDAADSGTGVLLGNYLKPALNLLVLPPGRPGQAGGDLNGDGKPDLLLWYTFGTSGAGSSNIRANADITILDSTGNFLNPYSAAWTRVYTQPSDSTSYYFPPSSMVASDYDRDGYLDLMIKSSIYGLSASPPAFTAYSLKKNQLLFQAVNSDLSQSASTPTTFFSPYLQEHYSTVLPADVNGDGWSDLDVFTASSIGHGLTIGLFNGWAGGEANKGRKIWLNSFPTYDIAFGNAQDFNLDDLMDFILVKNPTAPNTAAPGTVTWHVANAAVTAMNLSIIKEFDYTANHAFSNWNPANDNFSTYSAGFGRLEDIDGDGLRDTYGSLSCAFNRGGANPLNLAYGFLLVYDNNLSGTPDKSAELEIKVQGEGWVPRIQLVSAFGMDGATYVDNNRDGRYNDIIAQTDQAVLGFSFTYPVDPFRAENGSKSWTYYK